MNIHYKKLMSLLLVLCILSQYIPTVVFATVEDNLCEHHTIHEGCGFIDGEAYCGFVCEICTQAPVEIADESTEVEEPTETSEPTTEVETVSEEVVSSEIEPIVEEFEDAPVVLAAGEDLTWVLDSNGKLTITGTGSMSYEIPWSAYNSQITEVVIGEGVTSIPAPPSMSASI